jgi:predicted transcriptional regulator
LAAIADALAIWDKHQVEHKDKHQVEELTMVMVSVLKSLESTNRSRKEIFAAIGMNGDYRAYKRNIEPLLADGYIEMTIPGKPNSKLQKYRLTAKGVVAIRDGLTR